ILCHLEAFGVFVLIAAGSELTDSVALWRERGAGRSLRELAASASPFVATLLLFWLFSPTARVAGAITYASGHLTKPLGVLFSLSSGILWLDAVTAIVILLLLLMCLIWRQAVVSRRLLVGSMLLLAAFLFLPVSLMGATYVDSRLGPALATVALVSL